MNLKIETIESCRKLFETAAALVRGGKLDDAITIYDYLLIQDPSMPQYWTAGGIARMKKGHLEEACAQFQVAEAADEDNPVPVMLRGICLLRMGRRLEALIALRRAQCSASLSPENQWIADAIRSQVERLGETQASGCG
jgi:Flp pilus assembly protein TadD